MLEMNLDGAFYGKLNAEQLHGAIDRAVDAANYYALQMGAA